MTVVQKKTSLLQKVRSIVEKLTCITIGVLFTGMVIVVFGNVLARYVFNASIGWSEEVSRFMLIWITFLGAVVAYMRNEHLGLDLLLKYLPVNSVKVMVIAADLLVLGALAYMLNGGIDMAKDSLESGWVSSAVPIRYGIIYLVVPISSALMLLEGIVKIVSDLLKKPSQFRTGGTVC
jgi:TRAP-type transport system small permease protein